uniref:30S ribosomal protein S15 n=1 Tax=Panagrellus redivivus TaxID=6233 RepID=A0A7E4VP28_PANRE
MEVRIVQKGERKPNLSLKMILKRSKMTPPLLRRRYSGPVGRHMEGRHMKPLSEKCKRFSIEYLLNGPL